VNLVIRSIAVAFFDVPDGFTYRTGSFVIGSTLIFVVRLPGLCAGWSLCSPPGAVLPDLASVALFVSFLNPIMALAGLLPAPA
jgi:hypothetical protein